MNILNFADKSTLELVIALIAAVAALRLITAISFAFGRKAGRKQVFAAMEALDNARDAARRADADAADSRKWLQHRREESANVERDWQKFTYEHRAYVARQMESAETSFERALQTQRDANEALDNAREALEALK